MLIRYHEKASIHIAISAILPYLLSVVFYDVEEKDQLSHQSIALHNRILLLIFNYNMENLTLRRSSIGLNS